MTQTPPQEQDSDLLETRHRAFVERIVEFGKVWFLESDEGVAISASNDYEELEVIPFWSDKVHAKAAAREEWAAYEPKSVDLRLFLEFHIIKTSNEEILIGTNWNQNMFGREIHPLELALEIIELLKDKDQPLVFKHHANLTAYEKVTVEAFEAMMAAMAEDETAV